MSGQKGWEPLGNDFKTALDQLRIDEKERDAFTTYLSFAADNLGKLFDVERGFSSRGPVREAFKKKENARRVEQVAHFIWLFRDNAPKQNYPDYTNVAERIIQKIVELRNCFVHIHDRPVSSGELIVDQEFYRLIEGKLFGEARDAALGKIGLNTGKLGKMRLFNRHERFDDDPGKTTYEFTRKGLIFLVCLVLYRDDAFEFCSQFEDLQLPPLRKDDVAYARYQLGCENGDPAALKLRSRASSRKALLEAFTYYSIRRGRTMTEVENPDYLAHADILGYLNKVPETSLDYLTLDAERSKLNALAEQSTESEKNKTFKYALHARKKERFLPLAMAFCEDFNVFRDLKFKRLDLSDMIGRKKYSYEIREDEQNGMDRHYVVDGGAIRFAFEQRGMQKKNDQIVISGLNGTIGEGEFKRFIFLHAQYPDSKPGSFLGAYLRAYRTLLEKLLNEADPISLDFEKYRPELSVIAGCAPEALNKASLQKLLGPYLPDLIIRAFAGQETRLSPEELKEQLVNKIKVGRGHAQDFLTRLSWLDEWRKKNPRPAGGPGDTPARMLNYPPPSCRFSDGAFVGKVFDYLNLFLFPEEAFRQLPKGKQHRGAKDFEYQMIHADIGRYGNDNEMLWERLKKARPDIGDKIEDLRKETKRLIKKSHARPSLEILARAASQLYIQECEELISAWISLDDLADFYSVLHEHAVRFGVRRGQKLSHEALVRTILQIEPENWEKAWDYENRNKRDVRRFLNSVPHVAPQIPVPNGMAARCFAQYRKEPVSCSDFNKEFLKFDCGNPVLRDYYNVEPLKQALFQKRETGIEGLKEPDPLHPRSYSRTMLNKAISTLRNEENQDKLLLWIAKQYWKRYENSQSFNKERGLSEAGSIYDFFTREAVYTFGNEKTSIKVRMSQNDFSRPIVATIKKYSLQLAAILDAESGAPSDGIYSFYDLMYTYRRVQARDKRSRIEILPKLERFMQSVYIPQKRYDEIKQRGLSEKECSHEIREMEYGFFRDKYRSLSSEMYNRLSDMRNKVMHDGFDIEKDIVDALRILDKIRVK